MPFYPGFVWYCLPEEALSTHLLLCGPVDPVTCLPSQAALLVGFPRVWVTLFCLFARLTISFSLEAGHFSFYDVPTLVLVSLLPGACQPLLFSDWLDCFGEVAVPT